MAIEVIKKLQPHRTMHLRGFDGRGAAAALHGASDDGLTVSGYFVTPSDFCVLMLWDRDNKYEHYYFKYLPDDDFTNMVLEFDLEVTNLQPIDDPRFEWIPWRSLSYIKSDGTSGTIPLWDHAAKQGGTFGVASRTFTLNGTPVAFDRVTLWYGNLAFDKIVSNPPETASQVVDEIRDQINDTNWPAVGMPYALMASSSGVDLTIKAARYGKVDTSGSTVTWRSGDKFTGMTAGAAIRINGVNYTVSTVDSQIQVTLTSSAGTQTDVKYLAERGGAGANHIEIYELHKNTNLYFTPATSAKLTGGDSATKWRIKVDFSNLGLASLGQLWLTFAPRLADGAAYTAEEWSAVFSSWTVTDPSSKRNLKIAHPVKSVRVGSRDSWSSYTGSGWQLQDGIYYWRGFLKRSKTAGDKVTVEYHCQYTHDLYAGIALYKDRGIAGIRLDGDAETDLNTYLNAEPEVVTRRKVRSNVGTGAHTVELGVKGAKNAGSSDYWVYFDFLEAAVPDDVQDPAQTYSNRFISTDYDTDNGYQLSPQRLVWGIERLGIVGRIDHYAGVFFWNKRVRRGGKFHSVKVTFGGTWASGDEAFITIGGITMGKSVFPADTTSTIAAHFKYFINQLFIGVWASASGAELTITSRDPLYDFTFSYSENSTNGTMTDDGGDLKHGTEGIWVIDKDAAPVINVATKKWHEEYFAELDAKGYECVTAVSMELLNPPDDPGASQDWAAMFDDGTQVKTATGFGTEGKGKVEAISGTPSRVTMTGHGYDTGDSVTIAGSTWTITRFDANKFDLMTLTAGPGTAPSVGDIVVRNLKTTHCAFNPVVRDYLKVAYKEMADLISAATLSIWLQHGENVWWFSAGGSPASMAYYDAKTKADANTALSRALYVFTGPNDDPSVNSYADANFLRHRLRDFCSDIRTHVKNTYASAKLEVLWPFDVNEPGVERLKGM